VSSEATDRIIYGIQAVRHALKEQAGQVLNVYLLRELGRERHARLADELRGMLVNLERCDAGRLAALTGTDKHQGVAARIAQTVAMGEREARDFVTGLTQPLILILDGVQDPRNFGSCLRTAEAAGVDLVVTARNRSVDLTPVVSKVASGAAELQAQARVPNLARFIEFLREQGVWIVGADAAAEQSLFDLDASGATALVIGGEGRGLRRLTRERCDQLVRLPMRGTVDSLNLSVAAGVCLYECLRQRGAT
jgi:23S rRNA (guanosine2251-2'-O)-methyltransferase